MASPRESTYITVKSKYSEVRCLGLNTISSFISGVTLCSLPLLNLAKWNDGDKINP